MDRRARQRLATMVLTVLVVFSINTFSPVGSGDELSITITQTEKKTHQLPNLPGQQITILVGPDINPNWARGQGVVDSLIHDIVRPNDTVPAGVNEDYSHLVASNRDKETSLFFKADKKKMMIKYANYGEKLYTKTIPLSRLVERSYQTKGQCQ